MRQQRGCSKTLLIGTCLAAIAAPALSDEAAAASDTTTPTVVVTATRLPTPIGAVGSAVTVITAEDIERNGYRTVSEALRAVPGLNVRQTGGIGTQTSVFIRGGNANHTLFMLNGMDINDPSSSNGVYDPSSMLLENVARIEIVRGAQSVLYGSDAIGGVINIITKDGVGLPTASVSAQGGTFGTYEIAAGAGGQAGSVDLRVDIARIDTAGQNIAPGGTEKDSFEDTQVSARFGAQLTDNIRVDLFGQYVDALTDIDGFMADGIGFTQDRTQFFFKGSAVGEFYDGAWVATLTGGLSDQELVSSTFGTSEFNGQIFNAGLQNDIRLHEHGTLTLGFEGEIQQAQTTSGMIDDSIQVMSSYLQYQFQFWDHLSGTVGARVDHHDSFGTEPTWRVALAYENPETSTTFRGTVSTGFNAPSLTDLFGFFPGVPTIFDDFVGNPGLLPEKSFNVDFGIEQRFELGDTVVGATLFYNDYTNLIAVAPGTDFNDGVPDMSTNIGSATAWGVESFVNLHPFDFLDVNASYTYLVTHDKTNGGPLLRRPRHEFSGQVVARPTDASRIALEVIYVGESADFGDTIEDYVTLNVRGEYEVAEDIILFAGATNLTDDRSQSPIGFLRPGLEVFGGVSMTLDRFMR